MANFDVNKAIEHLRAKWRGAPCPMCHVANWSVQDSIYQLTQFNKGALVLGVPVFPVIAVVCSTCGNTVLVNAITAGLLAVPGGTP